MECPECGTENRAGRKFCAECGAKLGWLCPECDFENEADERFCGGCGKPLTSAAQSEKTVPKLEDMHTQLQSLIPDELAQKYMSAEQQATGENRPITALFADISGFTPLSNIQSSETIFQLVQDCFKQLVGVVARYEGSISGFRGDGLLALFGAPILHENDAERAILAATDMRASMLEQGLGVSIGVNTAMMTVGEIQTQLHSEYTAYGTDINLAKRLQEAAEAGQILIGTGTHRLTRRMFDFQMIADLNVKGFHESVTAYIVQQVKERPEKLRGIEGLRARMIGREHEFADLKDSTDAWLGGQGQIVSIIGEAGIGKSRLVSELREYLKSESDKETRRQGERETRGQGERETRGQGVEENISLSPRLPLPLSLLEGRCVSIGQPISYWPFLDILRAYFGLGEDDNEAIRARKVTESINQLMPHGADEALPLLGNLLSIKFGNELDDRLKFASPEQVRHQTLMRLRDFFETLARQQPLLLVLEDLHWADDLSLNLISLLMDSLANTQLMLLCVYRPEKEHRVWQLGDQARRKCLDRYTELTLQPLSSHESRLLVGNLLTIDNLPESTKEAMLTKSEGNPFFIEEVIRSLIEQDMIYREGDNWKARDEIANVSVPDTIQSVVLARVDRLQAEAKYVLQCASVIGRLFRHNLLQHISHQERDLDGHIAEFEAKELIYEERTVPELEYAFKHAFTQEATYEGILEHRRKEFHHQVAESIERLYQEHLDEYYEELAYHYSRSGDAEKAVPYLLKAGDKAKNSYANEASISYFQQVLDLLEQHGIQHDDWKLKALSSLGEVCHGMGKIAEAEDAFSRAVTLAKEMGVSPRQLARLYHWISEASFWQSKGLEVLRYGEMGLEILGDDTECLEAVLMNSRIAIGGMHSGDTAKYRGYTHRNMEIISKLEYSEELRPPYVHILKVVLFTDGDPEAAWKWSEELEVRANKCHDLRGLASAWWQQSLMLAAKGDYKGAESHVQKALKMFQDIGDDKHASNCHVTGGLIGGLSGWLLTLGDLEGAEKHARLGLELAEKIDYPNGIMYINLHLGLVKMSRCGWDEAIHHFHKVSEVFRKSPSSMGFYSSCAKFEIAHVYLKKGDYQAIERFIEDLEAEYDWVVRRYLTVVEKAYIVLGRSEGFINFCNTHREQLGISQPYLQQSVPSRDFTCLMFSDDFGESPGNSWQWLDEFEDCGYEFNESGGLTVRAANGRDMCKEWVKGIVNYSAPRLMREITGDFAFEVCVSLALDDRPHMGGLLVWKDKRNFVRFEIGVDDQHEVRLHGYVDDGRLIAGRGLIQTDENEEIHLRLERSGDEFSGYCSADGENWFTCGKMTLPIDDPIQIGIHAIGMIDRTIYCGAYKEGTATVFRNFRIWTQE